MEADLAANGWIERGLVSGLKQRALKNLPHASTKYEVYVVHALNTVKKSIFLNWKMKIVITYRLDDFLQQFLQTKFL